MIAWNQGALLLKQMATDDLCSREHLDLTTQAILGLSSRYDVRFEILTVRGHKIAKLYLDVSGGAFA